jgi:predicted permease
MDEAVIEIALLWVRLFRAADRSTTRTILTWQSFPNSCYLGPPDALSGI